ncbi:hypothetical protein POM88_023003 [Heracleum sosnowskyi]|uniref:Uncharacterized protein n=1 Tax=Heracleum sosnowskyi TaxID=360622 RepID=A0AAD8IHH8_9APIA|nr:hypothetical protein POM88_023003 [Heracleum sosnowskyi]
MIFLHAAKHIGNDINEEGSFSASSRTCVCYSVCVLQNPPMSSSFRHGQMHKVLKNPYGPMSEHRVLTEADDHHRRGDTNVRFPLSEHPLFTRGEENVHGCDSNVRVPPSQHPIFTQSNENEHPNIKGKYKRALAKSFSGRIPLSEHPMVKESLRKGTDFNADFNAKVQHLHSKGLSQTNRNNGLMEMKWLHGRHYSTLDDFDDSVYATIENSRIVGVDDSDDGMFSDDDMDPSSTDIEFDEEYYTKKRTVLAEYASLGAPSFKCEFCQAYMWKEERVNKNITRGRPLFSICCRKGQTPDNTGNKWQKCTMKDFYSYKFQVRHNEGMTPRLGEEIFFLVFVLE